MNPSLPAAALAAFVAFTNGCAGIAIATAPSRNPSPSTAPAAREARRAFHRALETGDYASLPQVTEQLTAAYLSAPNDPQTNLDLGMAHLWTVAERERNKPIPPTVIDQLTLADYYLGQAAHLSPGDARITGFQASARMALGSVHGDERWKRMGYFELRDAIGEYPEFNLFVLSATMIQLPQGDPGLVEAEDAIWKNLDACLDHQVDRDHLERLDGELRAGQSGPAESKRFRACFNSDRAPHNVEGFFLHLGDVLSKRQQPTRARVAYGLAKSSTSYATWPHAIVLEERLKNLDARTAQFRAAKTVAEEPELTARAGYFCVSCHQRAPGGGN